MAEPVCKVCGLRLRSMFEMGGHYKSFPDHRPLPAHLIKKNPGPENEEAGQQKSRKRQNVLTHLMYKLLEGHLKRIRKEGYQFEKVSIDELAAEVDADLGVKIRRDFGKPNVHITIHHIRRALNDYIEEPSPRFKRPQWYCGGGEASEISTPVDDGRLAIARSLISAINELAEAFNKQELKLDAILSELGVRRPDAPS